MRGGFLLTNGIWPSVQLYKEAKETLVEGSDLRSASGQKTEEVDSVTSHEVTNGPTMDEGTMETQNPKWRLHWCLIEFMDWRYSSHVGIFNPSGELLPLYLLYDLPHPSPFPK
jgi:hypothetical protein